MKNVGNWANSYGKMEKKSKWRIFKNCGNVKFVLTWSKRHIPTTQSIWNENSTVQDKKSPVDTKWIEIVFTKKKKKNHIWLSLKSMDQYGKWYRNLSCDLSYIQLIRYLQLQWLSSWKYRKDEDIEAHIHA